MTDEEQLKGLLAEAGRLVSAIATANQLHADFAQMVDAAIAGTGPAPTPDDAEAYERAIADARVAQPHECEAFMAKVIEILKFIDEHPAWRTAGSAQ